MKLQTIIKSKGKTCKEVASFLGITKQTFNYKCKKFENGKLLFTRKQLELIANFIDADVSIFFKN